MTTKQTVRDRELRAEFVRFFPELRRVLIAKFRGREPTDRAESVSEAIAFAFALWLSAKRRQKDVGVYSIANYAERLVKSGRRFAGSNSRDAMNRRCPHGTIAESDGRVRDLMLEDRRWRWTVLDRVAFKLDWTTFLGRLPHRTRRIVELLGEGYQRREAARRLRISPPTVTARMHAARRAWQVFQGEPALC